MTEFQEKNINEYIKLNYLFLDLLKSKTEDEDKLKLMKQNLNLMTGALKNLGVEFDDGSKRIRSLNERVAELEKELGNKKLSFSNVSAFINGLKEKIILELSEKGISGSVEVAFSPNLVVTVSLYSASLNSGVMNHWGTEKEFLDNQEKCNREYYEFIKNFDTVEQRDSYYMSYTENNIGKIKELIEHAVNENSDCLNYELRTMYSEDKSEERKRLLQPVIKEFSLTFFTLASSRSFSEALNAYYDQ